MEAIKQAFADSKGQSRSALLAYVTAGYTTIQETPDTCSPCKPVELVRV
jgi:tryptophan synthase